MPKFLVKIDQERCKGCGLCVEFCPLGLIGLGKSPNTAGHYPARFKDDEGKCKACGICYTVCPEPAIEVSKEETNE